MRIMVLSGTAAVLAGLLSVCVADSAFAASKKDEDWRKTYQVPNQSAQFYRSPNKNTNEDWRKTYTVPNQSAQFYRSSSHHHKKKSPAATTEAPVKAN